MCGPTGFGILYGKESLLSEMPPYRGGGDMIDKVTFEETTYNIAPFRFEAGTPPIAASIGFDKALEYLDGIGMANIAAREEELVQYRSEEHTSELQSRGHIVCRLLLGKKSHMHTDGRMSRWC